MARKNLSVITKQTGTPLEIAVIPRRLGTPVIVPPNQLTINFLRNLYDVSIVNVVDMQVLQYESGSSYWVNTSPVDAHTYFYTKDQVDALILDVSGAIIAGNFIKESSLGTDFVWNAGLLDVSIVTMDYAYVDGSLAKYATNASVGLALGAYATNASVNTALGAYATNSSVNFALSAYATNASVNLALEAYSTALSELDDVSIVSISDEQILAYDASISLWKNVDTIDLGTYIYSKTEIDASFLQNTSDTFTGVLQIDGSLRVGNYPTNYTEIGSDGTLRQYGNATTFEDLVIPLTQAKLGTNLLPDFDYDELAYLFPNNDATEILYFVVQMPHNRKYGSTVYPHVHYRQKTNVKPVFKLDYKWFNIGASVPSAWKTYVMDASVVAWVDSSTHQMAVGSAGIDGSTYGLSSMMLCKLYRQDASVTGDIAAWQFDIHYETDAFGSHELYTK